MNRQALADELNLLLALEARGLANHLREATPYLTPATYPVWRDIQRMLHDSESHADRLSRLLTLIEQPEVPSSFESQVASYHYADLGFLLPLLIEDEKAQIAADQRAMAHVGGDDRSREVSDELNALLSDHQTRLDQLEAHHRHVAGGTILAGRG